MIHVITGPPCAGKTTYMLGHAAEGDVLVDYDAIAQALGCDEPHQARRKPTDCNLAAFVARRAVIEWATAHAAEVESWIIHTNPMPEDMDAYGEAGAEVIALETDMRTCLERAERDGRPPGTCDAIREWFEKNPTAPKGAFFMPAKGGGMELKTKTVDVRADEGNGSITGYASTWTREPDSYGDVVAKGAFEDCIERIGAEGKVLPLLWNHESGDLKAYIGTVTELSEDDHGLLFTAAFDDTPEAQRARELAHDGRLAKFSFAYDVIDQMEVELEDGRKANELRKLNIHEVSLVLFPANRDTSVVEVKAAEPDAKSGRRNSKADEDELRKVLDSCADIAEEVSAIRFVIDGLLGQPADGQEPEAEAGEAEANAEEPDGANAEEPEAKSAEVEGLLQQADKLLAKGV